MSGISEAAWERAAMKYVRLDWKKYDREGNRYAWYLVEKDNCRIVPTFDGCKITLAEAQAAQAEIDAEATGKDSLQVENDDLRQKLCAIRQAASEMIRQSKINTVGNGMYYVPCEAFEGLKSVLKNG